MDDIVERLRAPFGWDKVLGQTIGPSPDDMNEAADEITALRAENERLRNELRFIASVIDDNIKETGEPHAITYKGERFTGPVADICVKLLRGIEKVARQALKGDKP